MGFPGNLMFAADGRERGAAGASLTFLGFLFFDLLSSISKKFLYFLGACSFIHFYFVLLLSPFGSDLLKWLISPFLVVTRKKLDNMFSVRIKSIY